LTEVLIEKRGLLSEEFNFYSFGIEINMDQKHNIMNNNYNRLLEKELVDQQRVHVEIMGELEPSRALTQMFKKTEELSLKKIQET
jgi:hypothetical protein